MQKVVVSNKQAITIIIMYIMASSIVLSTASQAKREAWLAIILAMIYSIPFYLIYARLAVLYNGSDLYDILTDLFGNVLGRIFIILYIWFAFHLGALVLTNFGQFIRVVGLANTPEAVSEIILCLLAIWAVKEGIEVVGRFTVFIFPILFIIIITITILASGLYDFNNLRPLLYNGIEPVLKGSYSSFMIPFAEVILVAFVLKLYNRKNKPYKVYFTSLIGGGLVILVITLRNILILGCDMVNSIRYPTYIAVSLIDVGEIIQRIEALVALVFIFAGFIKICVCLYAAANGIRKFFGLKNVRGLAAGTGFFMVVLAQTLYTNTMESTDFAMNYYPFYAIPYLIVFPIVFYITAEVKHRKKKKCACGENNQTPDDSGSK